MGFVTAYILLSLFVAWGYSNSTWGFGGGFLFCLLLSPVLGFIVMFFVPTKQDDTVQNQILLSQQQILQQQLSQAKPHINITDELTKLTSLKDKGLIDDNEFRKMRENIMKDFI